MSTSRQLIDEIAALRAAGGENDFPAIFKLLEERLLKAQTEEDEAHELYGNTTDVQL